MSGLVGLGIDIALPAGVASGPIGSLRRDLRRSRVPRSFGTGGSFISSPNHELPPSIFRGKDNPFSPPPADADDFTIDLGLDYDVDPAYAHSARRQGRLRTRHLYADGSALLSPPILWERQFGTGLAPGAASGARMSNFPDVPKSPSSAPPSPGGPSPTVPTTPTASASAESTEDVGHVVNPLFAASIALSVVLGVLLVGLATCGIIKCRKRRKTSDADPEKLPQTPSSASLTMSASPSFATAPSFHTVVSSSSVVGADSAVQPRSILLNSARTAPKHARRISFLEVPTNSIEDLHRQLYAPPGWHEGMPLPEINAYDLGVCDDGDGMWCGTPLDTITEESDDAYDGVPDEFVLPTIASVADVSIGDALGISDDMSDSSGDESHFGDAESTLSTAAPATPRASTSEPSLRSFVLDEDDPKHAWKRATMGVMHSPFRLVRQGYDAPLPHLESVLGALLFEEESEMDQRRAAFIPHERSDSVSSASSVKRSRSIPAKLSRAREDSARTRQTELVFPARRGILHRALSGTAESESIQHPAFLRFSGASWDALEDFDPYYTEAEGDASSDDAASSDGDSDEPEHGVTRRPGSGVVFGVPESEVGHSEACLALEEFQFPVPSSHLPYIRVTSH